MNGESYEREPVNYKLDQVAVRLVRETPIYSSVPIRTPYEAAVALSGALCEYDREVFCIVNLKTSGQPINFNIMSMGALNASLIHPRELFKCVFLSNAANIIAVHNHPSGDLTPSREDFATTNRLADLCARMGIGLVDHIIIAGGDPDRYYSFAEHDELRFPRIGYSADKLDYELPGLSKVAEQQEQGSAEKSDLPEFKEKESGQFSFVAEKSSGRIPFTKDGRLDYERLNINLLTPDEKVFLRMAPQPYEGEGLRIIGETGDIKKAIEYVTRMKETEKTRFLPRSDKITGVDHGRPIRHLDDPIPGGPGWDDATSPGSVNEETQSYVAKTKKERQKEPLFGPGGRVERARAKADELNKPACEQKYIGRDDPSL